MKEIKNLNLFGVLASFVLAVAVIILPLPALAASSQSTTTGTAHIPIKQTVRGRQDTEVHYTLKPRHASCPTTDNKISITGSDSKTMHVKGFDTPGTYHYDLTNDQDDTSYHVAVQTLTGGTSTVVYSGDEASKLEAAEFTFRIPAGSDDPEPDTPVTPDKPTVDPDTPVTPVKPTDPAKPANPTQPTVTPTVTPTKATTPATPTLTPASPQKAIQAIVKAAKTGDPENILLNLSVMMGAAVMLMLIVTVRKRQHKQKNNR